MNVMPRYQREDHIRALLEQPDKPTKTKAVPFEGKQEYLPIYHVPCKLPIYRLRNIRTLAKQRDMLSEDNSLPRDIFKSDPDSVVAQLKQHDILLDMVYDEGLLDALKREEQTDPLILTRDGTVVNGNRRLCAMRKLVSEDPQQYERFTSVDVVFLPVSEERSIESLEAKLQIVTDHRAKYTWVTEALGYKRKREEEDMSDEEIAALFGIDPNGAKYVEKLLRLLEYGENYLRAAGKSAYRELEKEKQALDEIEKQIKHVTASARDLLLSLAFNVMMDPDYIGDSAYRIIKRLRMNLGDFAHDVIEELGNEEIIPPHENGTTDLYELFPDEPESQEIEFIEAGQLVATSEDKHVREIIKSRYHDIRDNERFDNEKSKSLEMMAKAHSYLLEAKRALIPESELEGAMGQINSIEVALQELKKQVQGNGC